MKLLLTTYSSHPDYRADIDYALLEVTPELATLVLQRVNLFEELKKCDSQAYALYFWDSRVTFFGYDETLDEYLTEVTELMEVPESFTHPEPARTECDQMVITSDSVKWTIIPKNSDISITTTDIPIDLIKSAAEPNANG